MVVRIISGAVLVVIAWLIFALSAVNPLITIGFLALLSGVATFEALYNTGAVKNKIVAAFSVIYSVLATFLYATNKDYITATTVLYVIIIIVSTVAFHKDLSYKISLSLICMPILLSFGFNSIFEIFLTGIPYLFLLINFSAICDCGAYFTGVTIGKHKMCPEISPQKTFEGAVGGIVFSIIATVIIASVFNLQSELVNLLIFTPILCVVGMAGDLFASLIKRNAGIKDYGKIIPGHGGILDRFDSILLIAPAMVVLLNIAEAF